ncbi:uncharacterized protein AB675_7594 [Cyphellophora attinorum]|uniref:Uncharacterized protein n=1 Tax=Cyphellophora attinorum TaxID=1664694 RepID=A0A0N1HQQ2_9EURO|nr:uncharacterized protein AB675_7594 [Phialophora attinorum]KPI40356.1 hypothetical protein AB675_7594 [Phialophora attinorum]
MPIYLAHGFRWPRDGFTGIRVHAIIHNLEEVSVEYIQNPHSRTALANSLRELHPEIMQRLEKSGRRIDFLEQYDPEDESMNAVTQPYAFVCDRVAMIAGGPRAEVHLGDLFQTQAANASKAAQERRISTTADRTSKHDPADGSPERARSPQQRKTRARTLPMSIERPFNSPPDIRALSANVHDITNDQPIPPDAWDAMAELRDKLAKEETIGWWVVYNGDPERAYDPSSDEDYDSEASDEGTETGESIEEGVKEIRPKISAAKLGLTPSTSNNQPLAKSKSLPESRITTSPSKQSPKPTSVTKKPPPSALQTSSKASKPAGGALTANPPTPQPLKSPTGGRIPPPVPPPPPKSSARTPGTSKTTTLSPPQELLNMNKELPHSPAAEKAALQKEASNTSSYNSAVTTSRSRSNTQGSLNGACPANALNASPNQTRTGYRAPNQSLSTSTSNTAFEREKESDANSPTSPVGAGKKDGMGLRRKIFGRRGTGSDSR